MQASPDLQWLVIRNYNSKIVKRKQNGGKALSTERGNLRNLHSQKYSGLVNKKCISLLKKSNNTIKLDIRKADAPFGAIKSARSGHGRRLKSSNPSSARKVIAAEVSTVRPDLKDAVLARYSALARRP